MIFIFSSKVLEIHKRKNTNFKLQTAVANMHNKQISQNQEMAIVKLSPACIIVIIFLNELSFP